MKELYVLTKCKFVCRKDESSQKVSEKAMTSFIFNTSTWLPHSIGLGHWGMFISITFYVILLGIFLN